MRKMHSDRDLLILTEEKIQAGYKTEDSVERTLHWIDAWRIAQQYLDRHKTKTALDLERSLRELAFSDWLFDFQSILYLTKSSDHDFLSERIALCEYFIARPSSHNNPDFRVLLAEMYFARGECIKGEELFENWLSCDSQWGIGWLVWAIQYFCSDMLDLEKAERIIRRGLAVPGLRNRVMLLDLLAEICDLLGKSADAVTIRAEAQSEFKLAQRPFVSVKELQKLGAELNAATNKLAPNPTRSGTKI